MYYDYSVIDWEDMEIQQEFYENLIFEESEIPEMLEFSTDKSLNNGTESFYTPPEFLED